MRGSGVGSLRLLIHWAAVEPEPGSYRWQVIDSAVALSARHKMRVLPFIWGSPHWVAAEGLDLPVHSPEQRRAWAGFLRAVSARYGPGGSFWREHPELPKAPLRRFQIWNEENDINFSRASVSEYVTLLKVSRRALRAVDRRSRIVLGGLYSRPKKGHSIYAKVFLRRLYRHRGVKRLFDGVALHPYSFNPGLMAKAIREARREMVRAGDGGTALYITEFGWGSQRPAEGDDGFEKGPRKQAAYLRRAYRILLANRKRWRLKSAYWFTWQDVPAEATGCGFCDSSGLRDLSGRPKKALRVFSRTALWSAFLWDLRRAK